MSYHPTEIGAVGRDQIGAIATALPSAAIWPSEQRRNDPPYFVVGTHRGRKVNLRYMRTEGEQPGPAAYLATDGAIIVDAFAPQHRIIRDLAAIEAQLSKGDA